MGTSSSSFITEEQYEKERSEYWKKQVEIQQKHEEEHLKNRNIWTRENIPDFLERMYIHNLNSDYIEGPCGSDRYQKIGYNLHWKKHIVIGLLQKLLGYIIDQPFNTGFIFRKMMKLNQYYH